MVNVMNISYDGNVICIGFLNNGVYVLDLNKICAVNRISSSVNDSYLWHCRLGHISDKRLHKLRTEGLLSSLDSESFDT